MDVLKKYLQGQVDDSELDKATEILIEDHFDRQRRREWATELADGYNIRRKKKSGLRVVMNRRVLSIAAAVILLIASWFAVQSFNPSYNDLTDDYLAQHFGNEEQRKSASEDLGALRQEAINAYTSGNYAKAIQNRKAAIDQGPAIKEDYFYLGLSYLYNTPPNYQQAIITFNKGKDETLGTKLTQETNWFLALAYIKIGDLPKAEALLKVIVDNKHWKDAEAQQILESL